jgi:hypothetical protein
VHELPPTDIDMLCIDNTIFKANFFSIIGKMPGPKRRGNRVFSRRSSRRFWVFSFSAF